MKAFPFSKNCPETQGMDLRDYFAAAAANGMLSACQGFNGNPDQVERLATTAYRYADALMIARNLTSDQLKTWRLDHETV